MLDVKEPNLLRPTARVQLQGVAGLIPVLASTDTIDGTYLLV